MAYHLIGNYNPIINYRKKASGKKQPGNSNMRYKITPKTSQQTVYLQIQKHKQTPLESSYCQLLCPLKPPVIKGPHQFKSDRSGCRAAINLILDRTDCQPFLKKKKKKGRRLKNPDSPCCCKHPDIIS